MSADGILCPGYCGLWSGGESMGVLNSSTAEPWRLFPLSSGGREWPPNPMASAEIVDLILAHCKPCPWGTRRGGSSALCQPCETPLHAYDYLFILFHALCPFLVNSAAIGYYHQNGSNGSGGGTRERERTARERALLWLLLHTTCAVLESGSAFFGALLLFLPIGQLRTVGCQRDGTMSEWYSMWNNPVLEHTRVLRCSYELVYPLFSLPFVLLSLNLFALLLFRPVLYALAALSNRRRNLLPTAPFYTALWALPLLALVHSFFSGVLYSLFPYLSLLASLLVCIVHLSVQSSPQQQPSGRGGATVCAMFRRVALSFCCLPAQWISARRAKSHFTPSSPPLWLPLLIHLLLFAFSLLSFAVTIFTPDGQLDELLDQSNGFPLIAILVALPLPTLFFMLTVRLTAPGGPALANR